MDETLSEEAGGDWAAAQHLDLRTNNTWSCWFMISIISLMSSGGGFCWGWLVWSKSLHHRAIGGFFYPSAGVKKKHPLTGGGEKIMSSEKHGGFCMWGIWRNGFEFGFHLFGSWIHIRCFLCVCVCVCVCVSVCVCLLHQPPAPSAQQRCSYRMLRRCVCGCSPQRETTTGPHIHNNKLAPSHFLYLWFISNCVFHSSRHTLSG